MNTIRVTHEHRPSTWEHVHREEAVALRRALDASQDAVKTLRLENESLRRELAAIKRVRREA